MSAGREAVLREAEATAAMLRRCGYPEAQVAPEYCIGGEIGPDHFYTKTISVYVGPKSVEQVNRLLGVHEFVWLICIIMLVAVTGGTVLAAWLS